MAKNENRCDCNCIHTNHKDMAKEVLGGISGLEHMVNFYKAFADETRLRIMCILDKVETMCVCDIAVALNMTKSAISHQLTYLKNNYLVSSKKCGKIVYYSIADEHVRDIVEKGIEHTKEKLL